MNAFKPFPEVSAVMIGEVPRLVDSHGNDVTRTIEGCERLAACWNTVRKVAFPEAHVPALQDRCDRLENLRKEAWARVQELEAVQNA